MTNLRKRRAAVLGSALGGLWLLLGTSLGCYLSREPAEEQAVPDDDQGFHRDSAAHAPGGDVPASDRSPPPTTVAEPRDAATDDRPGADAIDAQPEGAGSTGATAPGECLPITDGHGIEVDDDGDAGAGRRARLTIDASARPEGTGAPDSALVVRAIKAEARPLVQCYALAPELSAPLDGSISVRFTVEGDGSVTGVEVTRDTLCGGVASCVSEILQGLALPGGSDAGSVTYSYEFTFVAED